MNESAETQEKQEKATGDNNKKLIAVALCIFALLFLLQGGYYLLVFLSREALPGKYINRRYGTVHAVASDTPYIDTKIDIKGHSLPEVYNYFKEIVLTDEAWNYKDTVRKWTKPIRFYAEGTPDELVEEVLASLFEQMNAVEGFPGISRVYDKDEANFIGYFYDDDIFSTASLEYCSTKAANGLSYLYLDENDYTIQSGLIMVRNEMTDIRRRSVISEELVQAMGLQNDSYAYPDSLFYQDYNEVPEPNELDWILFRLLYHPLIETGMNFVQTYPILATIIQR